MSKPELRHSSPSFNVAGEFGGFVVVTMNHAFIDQLQRFIGGEDIGGEEYDDEYEEDAEYEEEGDENYEEGYEESGDSYLPHAIHAFVRALRDPQGSRKIRAKRGINMKWHIVALANAIAAMGGRDVAVKSLADAIMTLVCNDNIRDTREFRPPYRKPRYDRFERYEKREEVECAASTRNRMQN